MSTASRLALSIVVMLAVSGSVADRVAAQASPTPCGPLAAGESLTVTGRGQSQSAPFNLAGGAYAVDWSTAEPTDALSFVNLDAATGPSIGVAAVIVNGAAGTSGRTYAYNVAPGTYYLGVRAPGEWKVSLTPIAL